jgi:NAD(P)-dependent dehydrogenase (short-subunit alcohol dehydrogenase family)
MLEDKVALVTGGNRGIGFEICRQLAQKGIKVILTARNQQKGRVAAKKLQKEGLDVVYHQLDVTDEESIKKTAEYVDQKFGKLDILINNAGILIDSEIQGLEADIDKVKRSVEVNTYGPLRVCKPFIPIMQKNNYGRIVNMSSHMAALHQMVSWAPGYRISKTALNAVTRILAHELRQTNITVNSVSPGWARTEMGGPEAPNSIEEGADTAVWLVTSDNVATGRFFTTSHEFSGQFFAERQELGW